MDPNACACMQVLAAMPISHYVAGFYAHHPGFCSMLVNTAFSLAAALFVFIILPAGDFVLGEEPPEAVSSTVGLHSLSHHSLLLLRCLGSHVNDKVLQIAFLTQYKSRHGRRLIHHQLGPSILLELLLIATNGIAVSAVVATSGFIGNGAMPHTEWNLRSLGVQDKNVNSTQNEEAYRAVLYTCVAAHWVALLTAMHLVGTTSINPLALLGKPAHPQACLS